MKKISLNLKTLRNSILIVFLSMSFATFAQNNVVVEYTSVTNAVKEVVSGSTNGVSTYLQYEITIPFQDNSLDKLTFKSNYGLSCSSDVMINVNGNNSQYDGNPITSLHKWYNIDNLPVGTHHYTIKSLCNGVEITGSRKLIRVIIVRELAPSLNLTMSAKCQSKHGVNNGYVMLMVNGTYTNASNLYIDTFLSSNACTNRSARLINMTGSNSPNNTVIDGVAFKCNSNELYQAKMFYKNTNVRGNPVVRNIPNGLYGWSDYSYRKRAWSCTQEAVAVLNYALAFKPSDSIDGSHLSIKNPVKSELNLFINSAEKMNYDIEIFDFSGMSVQKATLKSANIESTNTIDVQGLKKGIYIVQIKNGDSVIRKKMIKE